MATRFRPTPLEISADAPFKEDVLEREPNREGLNGISVADLLYPRPLGLSTLPTRKRDLATADVVIRRSGLAVMPPLLALIDIQPNKNVTSA